MNRLLFLGLFLISSTPLYAQVAQKRGQAPILDLRTSTDRPS